MRATRWFGGASLAKMAEVSISEVPTELSGVVLRELGVDDARVLFELIDRNREHLAAFGDYVFPEDYSIDDVVANFENPPDDNLRFAIVAGHTIVGRIDLNPVSPPHWSVGYFLDSAATGRGFATIACRALEPVARANGAVDLYAGVTTGNTKSCAVLKRAGYTMIQELPDRTRWWLPLVEDPDPPVMM